MKRYKSFISAAMMIVAVFFALTSCVKEGPAGPAGPAGVNGLNGVDGVDGLDGKDANESCQVCHTIANFDQKIAEYHLSKHYLGNTSARNGKFCARCHTHEGFQAVTEQNLNYVTNDMPNATRINCKTCHAHTGFDFSADTASEILSVTAPVKMNFYNNTQTMDFGAKNNLCGTCHQTRWHTRLVYSDTTVTPKINNAAFDDLPFFPIVNGNEMDTLQYREGRGFSVHDGNQTNLFAGIHGYEYTGKTYDRTWYHSTYACVDCHGNAWDETDKTGGHTLWVNENACGSCHGGSDKITPIQTAVAAKLVELGELLATRKVMKKTVNGTTGAVSYSAMTTHDFNGKLYTGVQSSTEKYAKIATMNTVSTTTGLVVYGNILTYAADADYALRIGRPWKRGELGAVYNYDYINKELSLGVHNKDYAMALLQNSIDWLTANP